MRYLEPGSDLFASPAQTLVNTVNTEGVMGAGIALAFKRRYPAMFEEYRALCRRGALSVGTLHLWRGPDRWVLNFPTKTTWRRPSSLAYVEAGLLRLRRDYQGLGITSLALPALGCSLGRLAWKDVQVLCERYLSDLPIPVDVYPPLERR